MHVDPIARRAARIEQQIDLVALHLRKGRLRIVKRNEADMLRREERRGRRREVGVFGQHADPEQIFRFAAEDEGEAEHHQHRHGDIPAQTGPVPVELPVARPNMAGCDAMAPKPLRAAGSLRKRSSRFGVSTLSSLRFAPERFGCSAAAPREHLDVAVAQFAVRRQ
jgi:hypothetical protein